MTHINVDVIMRFSIMFDITAYFDVIFGPIRQWLRILIYFLIPDADPDPVIWEEDWSTGIILIV